MILQLVEIDKPKTLGEKIAEYASSPPKPVFKFYGPIRTETGPAKKYILFAVRNGTPLPLLYSITAEAKYNGFTDYCRKDDHIGPFSTDNWRLTIETVGPAQLKLVAGLVPFEIETDTMYNVNKVKL